MVELNWGEGVCAPDLSHISRMWIQKESKQSPESWSPLAEDRWVPCFYPQKISQRKESSTSNGCKSTLSNDAKRDPRNPCRLPTLPDVELQTNLYSRVEGKYLWSTEPHPAPARPSRLKRRRWASHLLPKTWWKVLEYFGEELYLSLVET